MEKYQFDSPRPATIRYVFRCPACRAVLQFEKEELEVAGVDFLRLEHPCVVCGGLALVTVTEGELKVEEITAPAVRA